MLILTRRIGETMMVGDDVTVTVLGVNGNQVRMGINAPKEVAVHREEIYRKIHSNSPIKCVQESRIKPSNSDMYREFSGTIANIVHHKGFGFIYMPGSDNNIFFHASDMPDGEFAMAREGDELTFDVEMGDRGPVAKNIQPAA